LPARAIATRRLAVRADLAADGPRRTLCAREIERRSRALDRQSEKLCERKLPEPPDADTIWRKHEERFRKLHKGDADPLAAEESL
jgi:RNA processing factor Prp31